ncbi:MAG: tryptophan--tRNA ligase [Candidatus Marinimicrobia bacterium]|jgi:tryptophanyl-tRNA synthetase|nr:tryptophan--tRNA ligase [Candidatus Neomarinimicrobiota bacterium]MBT4361520.1 tryptophan--tRNA ligase [Candidatus Neomarinimicrobiota bacterium]MBT4713958.1 tryptophan--tRNA ligase [Candidatus Neomarinimicrobiota bacterium]MBT4946443.1 tryptophan--tRNA ligase [Candidatus Neomarinimicrobiota bacterium]MBT5269565.1 tryptophan--tRNA ligase [Candidatus Neomarinimicrobiota bacterium]
MNDVPKDKKPILLSGIQPSGHLALGNYVGAMRNWVQMQQDYLGIFMVVDMHAITVRQKPADLRNRCLSFAAQYLAAGIDPEENVIFIQSHVPQHAELAWVLNCYTYMGELNRMTQFKDKSKRHEDNINAGLYAYPALMAADILLYQTDLVPVGADQKQHLELTRDIANRFNNTYSPTFKVPEPFIPKAGARIMSLQDVDKKMSKSDSNVNNYISLLDPPDVLRRKIKRAVTDSASEITPESLNRSGIGNLLSIYAVLNDMQPAEVVDRFEGQQYSGFKGDLADSLVAFLEPFQQRYDKIMGDKGYLTGILDEGSMRARRMASKTISKVYRKLGFVPAGRS